MSNKLIYTLMLAAAVGLAACDDSADNAAEDARAPDPANPNMMNNDAAEQQRREEAEAAQRRADENGGEMSPPTAPTPTPTPPPTNDPQQ